MWMGFHDSLRGHGERNIEEAGRSSTCRQPRLRQRQRARTKQWLKKKAPTPVDDEGYLDDSTTLTVRAFFLLLRSLDVSAGIAYLDLGASASTYTQDRTHKSWHKLHARVESILSSCQAIAEAVWKLGRAFDTLITAHGRHHALIGSKKNTVGAWRTDREFLERKYLSAVTSSPRPPFTAGAFERASSSADEEGIADAEEAGMMPAPPMMHPSSVNDGLRYAPITEIGMAWLDMRRVRPAARDGSFLWDHGDNWRKKTIMDWHETCGERWHKANPYAFAFSQTRYIKEAEIGELMKAVEQHSSDEPHTA
ncbi:hypothetical protein B0I35DRAFT_460996 [Stachybotrys elegans]|uniref:Uncharacterized protein n=1 Tax=Stachybotrys elegans TaxID=80388 RepID=A0A8K0SQD9_9HYPO|nr:hypothetical protein B0I35DRAFT_460996 [Stachybotrys elegans]